MSVPPNATHEEIEALRRATSACIPDPRAIRDLVREGRDGDFGPSITFRRGVCRLIGAIAAGDDRAVVVAAIFADDRSASRAGSPCSHVRGRRRADRSTAARSAADRSRNSSGRSSSSCCSAWRSNCCRSPAGSTPACSVAASPASCCSKPAHGRPDAFAARSAHAAAVARARHRHRAAGDARAALEPARGQPRGLHDQARLRGFTERHILVRHALKNAFLPTLNLIGVQFGVPVRRHAAGRGDLLLSRHRQSDGRGGAQHRSAGDPGRGAGLLRASCSRSISSSTLWRCCSIPSCGSR